MFHRSLMPRTSLDSMFGCLSNAHGIATASLTSILSTFAHASARAVSPTVFSAAFIAWSSGVAARRVTSVRIQSCQLT